MSAPRRAALLALALAVPLVVAGCQGPPPATDSTEPYCADEGSASRSIQVGGDEADGGQEGQPPTAVFAPGLTVGTTERTLLEKGTGPVVGLGDLVTLDYVAYDAATGEQLAASSYGAPGVGRTLVRLTTAEAAPGLRYAVQCARVGSRIAAVIPVAEGFGSRAADLGVPEQGHLVVVIDLLAVASDRAEGIPQEEVEGLPTVTVNADGMPQVAVPAGAPPAEPLTTVLREGQGPLVREGSDAMVKYRGVLWRSGLSFVENWSDEAVTLHSTDALPPLVREAIAGHPVGSQLLIIVPPAPDFGNRGVTARTVSGTDTLVYVVDILAST